MPMRERPDLVSEDGPEGLQVFQLTTEETPSSHIYMEAQIFTPDSRRFLLHHPARAHGIDFMDPARRYLVCDLDAGGELTPITGGGGGRGAVGVTRRRASLLLRRRHEPRRAGG